MAFFLSYQILRSAWRKRGVLTILSGLEVSRGVIVCVLTLLSDLEVTHGLDCKERHSDGSKF